MAEFNLAKVDKVLQLYGASIKEDFVELLKKRNMNTGNLAKSFKFKVMWTGKTYTVSIKIADYYKYVEAGRKPGGKMPPLKILINWIGLRKIIPRKINGIVPTTKQLAFLIGRKIARDGIVPFDPLGAAVLLNEKEFKQNMEVALLGDIDTILRDAFYTNNI